MVSIGKKEIQDHIINIINTGRKIRVTEKGVRRKYLKKKVPEYIFEQKDKDGNITKSVRDWDYVYTTKSYSDRTIIYISQVVGVIWDMAISKGVVTHDITHNFLKLKDSNNEDIKLKPKKINITHIINTTPH